MVRRLTFHSELWAPDAGSCCWQKLAVISNKIPLPVSYYPDNFVSSEIEGALLMLKSRQGHTAAKLLQTENLCPHSIRLEANRRFVR